jgi:hypothetical protein
MWRTQMGAFWNPNVGIMISGRSLSKKEVSLLTRKWSEHSRFSTRFLQHWWRNLKMFVSLLFS